MFIGTGKEGLLHFSLKEPNRIELIPSDDISDKVITPENIENTRYAGGLGIITDVEVGPDGYLYIVTGARSPDGKIYGILPA